METYFITGVQLGIIKAFNKDNSSVDELIEDVIEKQQVSNIVREMKND